MFTLRACQRSCPVSLHPLSHLPRFISSFRESCRRVSLNHAARLQRAFRVTAHISAPFMCFQRSAMKPYTCAIMTWESPGGEFTCVMWNSAHVRPGKPTVNGSTTQVRLSAAVVLLRLSAGFACVIGFCWRAAAADKTFFLFPESPPSRYERRALPSDHSSAWP